MAVGLLTKRPAGPARVKHRPANEERGDLYEMANLFPEDTGLPVTVWVSPRGRHAARIKVCRAPGNRMVPSNTAVLRLEPEPALVEGKLPRRYLEPVVRWASQNRAALLRYWKGEIGTGVLIGSLQKLPSATGAAEPGGQTSGGVPAK